MKRSIVMAITSALISSTALTHGLAAQTKASGTATSAATANGPVPRMPDGRPDLSGVWWRGADIGRLSFAPAGGRGAPRPTSFADCTNPKAAAKAKTLGDKDDPPCAVSHRLR